MRRHIDLEDSIQWAVVAIPVAIVVYLRHKARRRSREALNTTGIDGAFRKLDGR